MDKLHLELSVEQMNVIFAALGKAPYESVFQLVEELNKQLVPQLQTTKTENKTSESEE